MLVQTLQDEFECLSYTDQYILDIYHQYILGIYQVSALIYLERDALKENSVISQTWNNKFNLINNQLSWCIINLNYTLLLLLLL